MGLWTTTAVKKKKLQHSGVPIRNEYIEMRAINKLIVGWIALYLR
jgi:hypothetical protein